MNNDSEFRLDGLEADNLLAFLALLGAVKSLEIADEQHQGEPAWLPRVAWDLSPGRLPVRPRLRVRSGVDPEGLCQRIAEGLAIGAKVHSFEERKDLNYTHAECRKMLAEAAKASTARSRTYADLLSALMSDAAVKDDKSQAIDPTPLCLMFGQGHQHFLERLASVPKQPAPPPRGRGRKAQPVSEIDCLHEALFVPWHREDPTASFRWDPEEDVRYALMAGDPTDAAYKQATQHGANRLAAVGFSLLPVVPEQIRDRIRANVPGGQRARGVYSFSWPIWRDPITLAAIMALLVHPQLRHPNALSNLGVDHVVAARRISVGKFMNFTRARVRAQARGQEPAR